jgi:hypothetical protein
MSAGLDFGVGVGDGLLHALAAETLFVAVAEFDGFVFAGAGAAGHGRAAGRAAGERHVHFHGGISARVENFARLNVLNVCHHSPLFYQGSRGRFWQVHCANRAFEESALAIAA